MDQNNAPAAGQQSNEWLKEAERLIRDYGQACFLSRSHAEMNAARDAIVRHVASRATLPAAAACATVAERTLNIEIPASDVLHMHIVRSQAARDVLAERDRQIKTEGWTPEHDDEHTSGCLAAGAACYALWAASQAGNNRWWNERFQGAAQGLWQWDHEWWKPKDARSNLVRAAALILAEIERLDRASSPASATEEPIAPGDAGVGGQSNG